jgi:hypothetical protein
MNGSREPHIASVISVCCNVYSLCCFRRYVSDGTPLKLFTNNFSVVGIIPSIQNELKFSSCSSNMANVAFFIEFVSVDGFIRFSNY